MNLGTLHQDPCPLLFSNFVGFFNFTFKKGGNLIGIQWLNAFINKYLTIRINFKNEQRLHA